MAERLRARGLLAFNAVTSLESIAGFGADPELAWEGFERWVALWLALEDVPVVRAFFDTSPEGDVLMGANGRTSRNSGVGTRPSSGPAAR